MTAATLDRERLAAVLGMLGSDHPGEILAAARQAERIRRSAGVKWADIIIRPALSPPTRQREIETVEDAIELCQTYAEQLTAWERNFVATLSRQRNAISQKQQTILQQIVIKVRAAEARAA